MSSTIAKPQETATPQNEEIRIELIEEKDSVAVLNMLKEFFFKVLYFKSFNLSSKLSCAKNSFSYLT